MFTPGIHSPNEIKANSDEENQIIEASLEEVLTPKLQFNSNNNKNKDCALEEFAINTSKLEKVLNQYYAELPKEFISFLCDAKMILKMIDDYSNTKFYWIQKEQKIFGLIIYSLDTSDIVIHHLSSLNFSSYPDIVQNIIKLLNITETNVVIQYLANENIPSSVVKVLKKKNFELITEKKKNNLTEYIARSKKFQILYHNLNLVASTIMQTSDQCLENNKICQNMIEVGNRHCLLSNILMIYEAEINRLELYQETNIRLQQDLNEQLEILLSLDYLKYPLLQTYSKISTSAAEKILQENQLKTSTKPSNSSFLSLLALKFHLIGCTYVTKLIENKIYKYFRFKSNKIQKKLGDDNTIMYIIPTSDKDISIFILYSKELVQELKQGLKRGKTDLFYNVDNIIKALIPVDNNEQAFELWMPCFKKTLEWNIPWIENFKILSENNNQVITTCNESINIEVNYPNICNNTLKFNPKNNDCVQENFVFGIYHAEIKEKLDSPLFLCLIGKDNLIQYQS